MHSISRPNQPHPRNPIILYLEQKVPYIPLLPSSTIIDTLVEHSNATVVYLEDQDPHDQRYPWPIYSALAAFDWIQSNLAKQTQKTEKDRQSLPDSKIGICGELSRGGLAAAIGLTECRSHQQGLVAVAAGNPIVDWTWNEAQIRQEERYLLWKAGHPSTPTQQPPPSKQLPTSHLGGGALATLRKQLFKHEETYHDTFASPLLFFRTPSYGLPSSHNITPDSNASSDDQSMTASKRRRYHKTYPPTGSENRLPRMRLEVGEQSLLSDQGMELVQLMRRSIINSDPAIRSEPTSELWTDRVEAISRPGLGLWGEKDLAEIGRWFGRVLV